MRTLIPALALILGGCAISVQHVRPVTGAVGEGIEASETGGSLLSQSLVDFHAEQAENFEVPFMDPALLAPSISGPELFDPFTLQGPVLDQPRGPFNPNGPIGASPGVLPY